MKTRTPCTPDEKLAIQLLQRCRFPTVSWDKRFTKQLNIEGLTEKERPQVWRLVVKYRRQIHGDVVDGQSMRGAPWQNLLDYAQKHAAPDLRKIQAAANEQAKIDQMRANQKATL